MPKDDIIWLGTPNKNIDEDFSSVYTSRIGGKAVLFREVSDNSVFNCPKCKNSRTVSLLAQIYAPLEVYDRILYVFICTLCSKEKSSFCFALRSQNFNPSYVKKLLPNNNNNNKTKEKEVALFEENTDWGDDNDNDEEEFSNNINNQGLINEEIKKSEFVENINNNNNNNNNNNITYSNEETATLALPGSKPPIGGNCYPCFGLEVFEEPVKAKIKSVSLKEQLYEAQKKYGEEVIETTVMEDEDEPLHEKRLRKYIERINRVPSQCIRWGPNQEPLQSSLTPITVPVCPYCKKERRYELQLTSPIIYFLAGTKDEKNHPLHFGNILIFTCSGNCNSNPYNSEYCIVEEEI